MQTCGWMMVVAGLVGNNACRSLSPGASSGQEAPPLPRPTAQATDELPVDVVLVHRWAELFAGVIQQFQRDHRDVVGNIEGDFTTRELRVRAASGDDNDSLWVTRRFSEKELRTLDLEETARVLYAAAKAKAP